MGLAKRGTFCGIGLLSSRCTARRASETTEKEYGIGCGADREGQGYDRGLGDWLDQRSGWRERVLTGGELYGMS